MGSLVSSALSITCSSLGRRVEFAWRPRCRADGTVNIVDATYGESGQSYTPKFPDTIGSAGAMPRGSAEECAGKTPVFVPL